MLRLFVSCAKGMEQLLENELQGLGAKSITVTQAGCYVDADLKLAYTIALWSRLASRVLVELGRAETLNAEQIQQAISVFDWTQVMRDTHSFVVDFHGTNDEIRNTQFGAQVVKDGIIDFFRGRNAQRPNVDKQVPDIRVNARYHKNELIWSLDFSGGGLHQRGYRKQQGEAPLRETLAAAVLIRAGIHQQLEHDEPVILDPFCGSGTLVIEAAKIAADQAPGLNRRDWGFLRWVGHDRSIWHSVLENAEKRFKEGRNNMTARFYASDMNPKLIGIAKENAARCQLGQFIQFDTSDVLDMQAPADQGLLIANPPYGERLGEEVETLLLYRRLGRRLKQSFLGWQIALLAGDETLLKRLKLRSHKKYAFMNGPIATTLALFDLTKEQVEFTESQSEDLSNRLKKNYSKLSKWARKEGLEAWRVYDADLPEYNAAIDIYGDHLVIQEYAPPKTIPDGVATDRLWHLVEMVAETLPFDSSHIVLKVRKRQKGQEQYERRNRQKQDSVIFNVQEYGAEFEVNLTDYLDTGLFLDHRLVRKELFDKCEDLDVLNLFSYTCTASVQAALGGAHSVTSVDMSKTYLAWGERNFHLNGLRGRQYEFIQADCFTWMRDQRDDRRYDVIFIDPPTFSNSKRMTGTLDIQRDHVGLIKTAGRLLNEGGVILFSNNRKKFKIDEAGLEKAGYSVNNQTEASIPEDFKRHKGIHHYFIISKEY